MMFPDSGLVVGPSHSDGGVYASVANGPDVELEGGEFIINKEATEDFLPLFKQINDIGSMEQMHKAENAQNAHTSSYNGIYLRVIRSMSVDKAFIDKG